MHSRRGKKAGNGGLWRFVLILMLIGLCVLERVGRICEAAAL
jgi:hypothetical protein